MSVTMKRIKISKKNVWLSHKLWLLLISLLRNPTVYKLRTLSILDSTGVNQGDVARGLLFRKYKAGLKLYMDTEVGNCVENMIISHLLWADDIIL